MSDFCIPANEGFDAPQMSIPAGEGFDAPQMSIPAGEGFDAPTTVPSPGLHPSNASPFLYGYGGYTSGPRDERFELGVGAVKHDNLDLWNGSADLGFWGSPEGAGVQGGFKGEANSIGVKATAGDLLELATLGHADTEPDRQGGFSNFLSGEVHGPRAAADLQAGTDGFSVGAGAELAGASVKVGGAEYNWLGGTELSLGAGLEGVGANAGLSWSDDDQDGLREYGFALGGELGVGVDGAIKTELPGHILRAITGE